MAEERIDIVIAQSGAEEAAAGIQRYADQLEALQAPASAARSSVEQLLEAISASSSGSTEQLAAIAEKMDALGQHAHEAAGHANELKEGLSQMAELFAVIGVGLGVGELIKVSDAYSLMSDKIRAVSTDQEAFNHTMEALEEVANNARQSTEGVASVYSVMARGLQNTTVSEHDMVEATKAVAEAQTVAGLSGEGLSRMMRQLQRSFADGYVSAQLLSQMQMRLPSLLAAVQVATGKTAKELEDMAKSANGTGLSVKQFTEYLAQAAPVMDQRMAGATLTVAGAMQVMQNRFDAFIGTASQASGAGAALANTILFLSEHLNVIIPIAAAFTAAVGAWAIVNVAIAMFNTFAGVVRAVAAAMVLLDAAMIPIIATVVGIMAVVAGLVVLLQMWRMGTTDVWAATSKLAEGMKAALGEVEKSSPVFGSALNSITNLTGGLGNMGAAATKAGTAMTGLGAATQGATGHMGQHGAALTTVQHSYGGLGGAMTTTTEHMKGVDGQMVATGQTIKSMTSDTETLTKTALDADGQLTTVGQTVTRMADGVKTTTEYIKGMDGSLVQASQHIETGIVPAGKHMGDVFNSAGVNITSVASATRQAGQACSAATPEVDGLAQAYDQLAASAAKAATAQAAQGKTQGQSFTGLAGASYDQYRQQMEINDAFRSALGSSLAGRSSEGSLGGSSPWDQIGNNSNANYPTEGGFDQATYTGNPTHTASHSSLPAFARGGHIDVTRHALHAHGHMMKHVKHPHAHAIHSAHAARHLPKFAAGGMFEVGGYGGVDSQLVSMMVTPGERVTVQTPQQAASGAAGGDTHNHINLNMVVNTPDANSFRRSRQQTFMQVNSALLGVANRMNA